MPEDDELRMDLLYPCRARGGGVRLPLARVRRALPAIAPPVKGTSTDQPLWLVSSFGNNRRVPTAPSRTIL